MKSCLPPATATSDGLLKFWPEVAWNVSTTRSGTEKPPISTKLDLSPSRSALLVIVTVMMLLAPTSGVL